MPAAVVVFTRDLRVRDNPALAAAVRDADAVVPLFVLDDRILGSRFAAANRLAFLTESLTDLDARLRERDAALVVRRGDWVDEVATIVDATGAQAVHVAADVSGYAQRRLEALRERLASAGAEVVAHPGVTVVPPGAVAPAGSDHYRVFTPYHRRWLAAPWRPVQHAPRHVPLVDDVEPGDVPRLTAGDGVAGSPRRHAGGETEGRKLLAAWAKLALAGYEDRHDDLAGDATSHVSAHLHFGTLSPLEVATRLRDRPGAGPFLRQLCWRDFFHQLLAARPEAAWHDLRPVGGDWQEDRAALAAWRDGRTGYPVVDAAMRQLRREGFVHNRARLVAASFLTKDLGIDWRAGARHFLDWLVDGDVANNNLNWQWVAGTGTDTNPHRIFNPTRQGERFDANGDYVRRYVPELAGLPGGSVHDPGPLERAAVGYPEPIVDHADAIAAYRARLG
jgi:deoxyribodipyrimidine photo-lyase